MDSLSKRNPYAIAVRHGGAMLLVILLSALSVTASAEPSATAPRAPSERFLGLDVDRDGYISRAESQKLRDFTQTFDDSDLNHDGRLDPDEFARAESIMQLHVVSQYIDDSLVTAKIKALLLKEMQLKSTDVSVQTMNGKVLLSGFVDSDQELKKIMQVAYSVAGVAGVRNGMVVK